MTELAPNRWTASLSVNWGAMLTFGRRRDDLLEWVDEHCDLAAFIVRDDLVGFAIGGQGTRVEVGKKRLALKLLDPRSDFHGVQELLAGIGRHIAPETIHGHEYRARWSVPISGNLEDRAQGLATRVLPVSILTPRDVAVLADLAHPDARSLQIEYGIVDAAQLRDRLTGVEDGRIGPTDPIAEGAIPASLDFEAALFADIYWAQAGSLAPTSISDLLDGLVPVETLVTDMLRELAGGLQ